MFDRKASVDTGGETEIGFRRMQSRGLGRTEVFFVAQYRNTDGLPVDGPPKCHPLRMLVVSFNSPGSKIVQKLTPFSNEIGPVANVLVFRGQPPRWSSQNNTAVVVFADL